MKLFFLFFFFLFVFSSCVSQINTAHFKKEIGKLFGDTVFEKYDRIYLINPDFCSGTKYCKGGETILLNSLPFKKKILILTSNSSTVQYQPNSNLHYKKVDMIDLQEIGLFSVYPYYYERNKICYKRR